MKSKCQKLAMSSQCQGANIPFLCKDKSLVEWLCNQPSVKCKTSCAIIVALFTPMLFCNQQPLPRGLGQHKRHAERFALGNSFFPYSFILKLNKQLTFAIQIFKVNYINDSTVFRLCCMQVFFPGNIFLTCYRNIRRFAMTRFWVVTVPKSHFLCITSNTGRDCEPG